MRARALWGMTRVAVLSILSVAPKNPAPDPLSCPPVAAFSSSVILNLIWFNIDEGPIAWCICIVDIAPLERALPSLRVRWERNRALCTVGSCRP